VGRAAHRALIARSSGGEEGYLGALEKVANAEVNARLRGIRRDPEVEEEADVLRRWLELSEAETRLKREARALDTALDTLAYEKYPTLGEAEVRSLVIDEKWMAHLSAAVQGEVERLSQERERAADEAATAKAQVDLLRQSVTQLQGQVREEAARQKEAQGAIAAERQKRLELERKVSEAEGRAEALADQVRQMESELDSERSVGGAQQMKKMRDELAQANKKAIDAQVQLQNDRREREALEQRAQEAEKRVEELERKVEEAQEAGAGAATTVGVSPEVIAERDKLREDVAAMKKKLSQAEAAREAAASLKKKVEKLEAELKKLKK
jgi:chromosome segregation ATPase